MKVLSDWKKAREGALEEACPEDLLEHANPEDLVRWLPAIKPEELDQILEGFPGL